MRIDLPYEIGDEIIKNGRTYKIKGIHLYITETGKIVKWRFHVGFGKFITVENNRKGDTYEFNQKKKTAICSSNSTSVLN